METAASHSAYGADGPLLMGITWTEAGIATLIVAARAYAALRLVRRAEWDLFWVTCSWALAIASQINLSISAAYGSGNHIANLTYPEIVNSQKYSWIGQIIAIFAIGFGKIAIVALLLRIQGPAHRKKGYFLHFIWISNTILNISQTVIILLSCSPYQRLWNMQLPGNCNNLSRTSHTGYLQGGWAAASDVVLATYPIIVFWTINLSWKKKLGLCALMGGGYITAIAAALKTVYIKLITTESDATYAIVPLLIWAYTEQWLLIILGSIPQLRVFFVVMQSKRQKSQPEDNSSEHEIRQCCGAKHQHPDPYTLGSSLYEDSKMSTARTETESGTMPFQPLEIRVTTNYEVSYDKHTIRSQHAESSLSTLPEDDEEHLERRTSPYEDV